MAYHRTCRVAGCIQKRTVLDGVESYHCRAHACCKATTTGTPCSSPVTVLGYHFCDRHVKCKDDDCTAARIGYTWDSYETWRFCARHSCDQTSCPRRRGKCESHSQQQQQQQQQLAPRCRAAGCADAIDTRMDTPYCKTHACRIFRCQHRRDACPTHQTCAVTGCARPRAADAKYCTEHAPARCASAGCPAVLRGARYCRAHVCQAAGCARGRAGASHDFCLAHTCCEPGCTDVRARLAAVDDDSAYCQHHECATAGCAHHALRAGSDTHCARHACAERDCAAAQAVDGRCAPHWRAAEKRRSRELAAENEKLRVHLDQAAARQQQQQQQQQREAAEARRAREQRDELEAQRRRGEAEQRVREARAAESRALADDKRAAAARRRRSEMDVARGEDERLRRVFQIQREGSWDRRRPEAEIVDEKAFGASVVSGSTATTGDMSSLLGSVSTRPSSVGSGVRIVYDDKLRRHKERLAARGYSAL